MVFYVLSSLPCFCTIYWSTPTWSFAQTFPSQYSICNTCTVYRVCIFLIASVIYNHCIITRMLTARCMGVAVSHTTSFIRTILGAYSGKKYFLPKKLFPTDRLDFPIENHQKQEIGSGLNGNFNPKQLGSCLHTCKFIPLVPPFPSGLRYFLPFYSSLLAII